LDAKPLIDHISRPRLARLGQAVINVVLRTGKLERIRPEDFALLYGLFDQRRR
jgi:hypothetical protein